MFKLEENGKYDLVRQFDYHTEFIYCVCSTDKAWYTGSKDKTIMMMDKEGNPIGKLEGHDNAVNCIKAIGDSKIISGSWDGTAKIWDLASQSVV